MSHTPGPWFVRAPDGDAHTEVYSEKTGAVCYPEPDDAYLIAAAPEMLKTLRFVLPVLENAARRGTIDAEGVNLELEAAREVADSIAKAEGRSE